MGDVGKAVLNPGELFLGGKAKDTNSFFFDPMDLWGYRGERSRDEIGRINEEAASAALKHQEEAYNKTVELQKPYMDYGMGALGSLENFDPTFSPQFSNQLNLGTDAILRSQAARGMLGSTDTANKAANFYNQLSGEDIQNQWQDLLDDVNIGLGSSSIIGGALGAYGAGANNIYGNLGQATLGNILNYGANRANSFSQFGDLIGGIGYRGANSGWFNRPDNPTRGIPRDSGGQLQFDP